MAGAIAHEQAQQLREVLGGALTAPRGTASPSGAAVDAFLRLVDILETSPGAVVLPADELLSTQEAAELLGVSRMTVVRLVDKGDLVATGGGVHRRIAASEVACYREATAVQRRQALHELAEEIGDDTPVDYIIPTR